jgi:hypothetical protein
VREVQVVIDLRDGFLARHAVLEVERAEPLISVVLMLFIVAVPFDFQQSGRAYGTVFVDEKWCVGEIGLQSSLRQCIARVKRGRALGDSTASIGEFMPSRGELYIVPWDYAGLRGGLAVSRIVHAAERSA